MSEKSVRQPGQSEAIGASAQHGFSRPRSRNLDLSRPRKVGRVIATPRTSTQVVPRSLPVAVLGCRDRHPVGEHAYICAG
jgi:hypothetical protein